MPGREPLSVAVITYNEARNIGRCLASVAWADEIVVVDAESDDATREIATRHGARVHVVPWRGFVEQKNHAVSLTRSSWVLSLDADEWIDDEGAEEIRAALAAPEADVYAMNRRSAFSGAFLDHTWRPDWQRRLFRRNRARFEGGHVHESLAPANGARVARLRSPLHHMAYRSIHDYVERMNRYTDLAARSLEEQGRSVAFLRLLVSPPAAFFKHYLLRRGFLDGVRGLVISAGSAYYVLLKYAKLWERRRPDELDDQR